MTLVLAVAVAAYLYVHLDEEITRYAHQYLASHYRDLEVRVGGAHYVPGTGVVVERLTISEPRANATPQVILEIPELRLIGTVDAQALSNRAPRFDRIEAIGPTLNAVRQADGRWSVQRLLPLPKAGDGPTPPVHVHGATVSVSDATKPGGKPITLRNVNLAVVSAPAEPGAAPGVQRLEVDGQAEDSLAQLIKFQGVTDTDGGRVDITLDVAQLSVTTERLLAAPGFSPLLLMGLTVDAKVDAHTTLRRTAPTDAIAWKCDFVLSQGTLKHPLIPKQMTEVEIRGECDPAGLKIKQATAKNGGAELTGALNMLGWGPQARAAIRMKALRVEVNDDLYRALPADLQRGWNRFEPRGEVDAYVDLQVAPGRVLTDLTLSGRGLSFTDSEKFPYRVTAGTGTIRFNNMNPEAPSRLTLSLAGQAEGRAVEIGGEFLGLPQPPAERGTCPVGMLRVSSNSARVTPSLLKALPDRVKPLVESLNPQGEFGFTWTLRRDSPQQAEPMLSMDLLVHDGSVAFDKFPYPLRGLSGQVQQRDKLWTLTNFVSRADPNGGVITAAGDFDAAAQRPLLRMQINGAGVPLDASLRAALPPDKQAAWDLLQPTGRASFEARVAYSPGDAQPDVSLRVEPYRDTVSLQPRSFPYRLDAVQGAFEFSGGQVRFDDARAQHGPTRLMADGQFQPQPSGGWRFDLVQLNVERLDINSDFRAAAPLALRNVIDCLDPQGGLGVHDGRLSFAQNGVAGQPVVADWDLHVDCLQLDVNTGARVDDVCGTVRLAGSAAGGQARAFGELDLNSLLWNGIQLTKVTGPLYCDKDITLLGRGVAERQGGQPRPITAQAYGGVATMDGHAVHGATARYGVGVTLKAIDLSQLGADYLHNRAGMAGKMDGEITLQGLGSRIQGLTGSGRLEATEADLYELPILVAMLKVLRNRPVDSTAFNKVEADFTLQGEHVQFQQLNLLGDAISLYGRGEASLDRNLNLVFHTMVGQNGLVAPVLRTLAGQASEQLLKINVTGPMDNPEVTPETLPLVSNVFQQLQQDFRPQPLSRPAALPSAAAQRR